MRTIERRIRARTGEQRHPMPARRQGTRQPPHMRLEAAGKRLPDREKARGEQRDTQRRPAHDSARRRRRITTDPASPVTATLRAPSAHRPAPGPEAGHGHRRRIRRDTEQSHPTPKPLGSSAHPLAEEMLSSRSALLPTLPNGTSPLTVRNLSQRATTSRPLLDACPKGNPPKRVLPRMHSLSRSAASGIASVANGSRACSSRYAAFNLW